MVEHSNQQQRSVGVSAGMEESISALVDGEVSEMELHRVLKAAESDSSVRQTWSRYQLVSAAMRNDLSSKPLIDLSAAIREAIDEEETIQLAPQRAQGSTWWRNLSQNVGKLGIAASVAAVMVVTSQMVGLNGDSSAGPALAENAASSVRSSPELMTPNPALPAGFQVPSVSARTVSTHPSVPVQEAAPHYSPVIKRAQSAYSAEVPAPEVQAYLQRVMEIHAGNAALNSSQGMLPYARVPAESHQ